MSADLRVALLQYTPSPERAVASAGRLCYAPVSAAELKENMSDGDVGRLIARLLQSGHLSTLEHASFSFAVDGISRACSHQLVRHRMASYSQQSQRYVHFGSNEDFVVPPSIEEAGEAVRDVYGQFCRALSLLVQTYEMLLEAGIPAEDARYVLPNAAKTNLVVTMNARELRHFFSLRCCKRAQWEIRELAEKMLEKVKAVAPALFENAGPGCVSGACPEGEMSCNE